MVTVLLIVSAIAKYSARRRAGLRGGNLTLIAARPLLRRVRLVRGRDLQPRPRRPVRGLIIVLLIVFTFLAQRATFGRHVYAVGGNAEAARRAGINVKFIRIIVFMISGMMAAVGGIVSRPRCTRST